MSIYFYLFIGFLIIIAISSWFLKKKVGKIIFIISVLSLLLLIILFFRHDIIFFFDSLQYDKYCNYNYSNDINQYGFITKEGAIKIAQEDTNSSRIGQVECELVEGPIIKSNDNAFLMDVDRFLYGEEKFKRMKQVTKYWSINLVTGWDKGCGHYEEHFFTIDYYTGEIFEHSQTM